MRQFWLGMALLALAVTARADEEDAQPRLVPQAGGHTAAIWKLLFTPDGKEIVTVSEDKTVRVWDAVGGERSRVIRPPVGVGTHGELRAGALSPDGKTLAVGGVGFGAGDTRFIPIYLIDLAGGRITATLKGPHKETVSALAFSHDGKLLASGSGDGAAYLWDAASGQCLHTLEEQKDVGRDPAVPRDEELPPAVRDLAFSPDDKVLATASWNKTAFLWNVADGKKAAGPLKHEDAVLCVAWKDDDTLATGGVGRAFIHLWDRKGNALRHLTKRHSEAVWINSIAFLPGKEELFYAWTEHLDKTNESCESGAYFLDLAQPDQSHEAYTWHHATTEIRGALSPDGRLAAVSGGNENQVGVWNIKEGKRVLYFAGKGRPPYRAGWDPKSRVVAWTSLAKEGRVLDDAPLKAAFDFGELRFAAKPDATFGRALHAAGDLSVERSALRHVQIKNKMGLVADIETPSVAQCYTLLPRDRIAVGFADRVYLYNARTGELIRKFSGHSGKAWDLAPSPDGRYLLGAFSDRTLRVWDPDADQPLLSLFVAGADWAAWTPEGYYAASPAGEKLMGWQVNHGLEQLGAFYPASQFHNAFYRPDLIRRVLAEGSAAKAREAADKESGVATAAVDVAHALPPEATIRAPAEGELKTAEVVVRADAVSADQPVASLRLLLDGRPFPAAEVKSYPKAKRGEKQDAVWNVTMPPGEHALSVLAESAVSSAPSAEVKVSYRPGPQEPLPTLYVLAVGINAYPGSLKLNWAVDDAAAVQKAFRDGGAPKPYGKVETRLLLDRDASKQGIVAGLDWLKEKMTADDTAVVFYAGHGHRDRKTGQFYLLPQDVDVTAVDKTGVTGTMLKDKLKAAPGRVLVLLDACHSGSIGQSPADPGSLTDDVQRQLVAPDCGVVVMCAAMAQEEAGEAAAVKHGFFTAALLSGLGGKAPAGKDGLIHLTALNYYVEEAVSELSKDEQHVVVDRPSTVTSFPLVKPPAVAGEK